MKWKLGALVFVALIVFLAAIQNRGPVVFRFWPFPDLEISKTVLIAISALLGAALTLASQWYWRHRRSSAG